MTYFELFEIPVQLKVDTAQISRKYFELSRKHHPDYHSAASPEDQSRALELSAMLNRAMKTFQDPDQTIRYVLQLKGLLEEEEKYELPQDFLMEVLEVNEALMDADEPETRTRLNKTIQELEKSIYSAVEPIITNYREGLTPETDLLQVKEYYFKKKYIDRLRKELSS